MSTDTTERGLERRICITLTGGPCEPDGKILIDKQLTANGCGWTGGNPHDYDREICVDLAQLSAFLLDTQPAIADGLDLKEDSPTKLHFLTRLQREVGKRGVIDVLRKGVKHQSYDISLFYGTPSVDNKKAQELFLANRFSVTRQLRYSLGEKQRALDLVLFINGLPIATFELKNNLTKQTVNDAILQYQQGRDPRERLFAFGRCVAHFAVDENEVYFCTHLRGKASWFLPFNCGWNDGGGNPPNPDGLKTDYLWREVLVRKSLTNILEKYVQTIKMKDGKTGKIIKFQIWPRYHQLDVVRRLLADIEQKGTGQRYLIQHSAGSGKSNSIAWLAHQLIELRKDDQEIFDSIIVVTDRRVLDQQIRDIIKQSAQVSATIGHAERSGDLRQFIESGKKIIISTVQKFPFILDEILGNQRDRRFAIIIDEAHSSQGGRTSAAIAQVLSQSGEEMEYETFEDKINQMIETRRLLPNASYFAFTATPKNKTLEIFGQPEPQPDGTTKHRPFHSYTMKQAIEECFILDVLAHYTPVKSYYRLAQAVEDDPQFDVNRAGRKLRRYVESHDHAIRLKAEIMVDHFHDQVVRPRKIGGQARAMVVTNGVHLAIQYFHAIREYLQERKSPYQTIVAFSGEHEYGGIKTTETSLNEFPANQIPSQFREDPYRFLVCADKFQTGYDEPLLHTMYVDKTLSGIKAVQTLSRLNRAEHRKSDVFVLDFMNDTDTIRDAFADYYRTTILSDETDPNRLHDLKAMLDSYQVYTPEQIDDFVRQYLDEVERGQLDPILDNCVEVYREHLDEDDQVKFKGSAKAFVRAYNFLSVILPYANPEWEKLSIFLNFLVLKLPAPVEEDLSRGILSAIDMDSYRAEKQATARILLDDEDAEIDPLPPGGAGGKLEPDMDYLSNIVADFNNRFGNIAWKDQDRILRMVTKDIPERMNNDRSYHNAKMNADRQNARIEHDRAFWRVIAGVLQDDAELFKQLTENESFQRWAQDTVFSLTYDQQGDLLEPTP